MKLAEALIERADLQRNLKELSMRILNSVVVQEGDLPQEDVQDLLLSFQEKSLQLEDLVKRINRTNFLIVLEEGSHKGHNIMELLAKRDTLAAIRNQHLEAFKKTLRDETTHRYTRNEIKTVVVASSVDLKKSADTFSKQHRELDTKIQQLNWITDLI